jgi:hypothetical protein
MTATVTTLKTPYYIPARIDEQVLIIDLVRALNTEGLTISSLPGGVILIHRFPDKRGEQ